MFLIPTKYGYLMVFVLWMPFGSLYIMQQPPYLDNITLVSIWFRMVLTQIITHV